MSVSGMGIDGGVLSGRIETPEYSGSIRGNSTTRTSAGERGFGFSIEFDRILGLFRHGGEEISYLGDGRWSRQPFAGSGFYSGPEEVDPSPEMVEDFEAVRQFVASRG